MSLVFWGLFFGSCVYLVLKTLLAQEFARERLSTKQGSTPLSFVQVKPLYRSSSETLKAIESFLTPLGSPKERLIILASEAGPQEWLSFHPEVEWFNFSVDQSQNGKAAMLAAGESLCREEVIVVSDADMWAPPGYSEAVLAPFQDPKVGLVTCLYTSTPPVCLDWCHLFESLCILDFSASVLVARKMEGMRFAMGSTMAVRREALTDVGGFQVLVPYLADDYQLGYRVHQKGWRIELAPVVLETTPPEGSLWAALSHQYRWLVTSRVSRPSGHGAFILTQGFVWAIALAWQDASWGWIAVLLWMSLRIVCGSWVYFFLGGARRALWQVLFLPWKDVLYFGLWLASFKGQTVRWGERFVRIDRIGRILK